MITIGSIPVGVRTPGAYIEINNARAAPSLAPWQTRILIMGQTLPSGTYPNLQPRRMVNGVGFPGQQGASLFGRGSMLDRMIQAVFANNPSTETWAMGVHDNLAGVAAVQTLTFTGAPTNAGTLALYIAGQLVPVGVAATDTLTAIAANVAAAINADPDLPVTATSAVGVVTCTARNAGEVGNGIDYRLNYYDSDTTPPGLVFAQAQATAGAGNPVLTSAIAALGDTWWNTIIFPWTDGASLAAITTELATRRGPMVMKDGIAYSSAKGSVGGLATLGTAQNSPDLSISECRGPAPPWERAAREGALINFYGSIDPPRPLQTLALVGDMAPWPNERFTQPQRDTLLHDGISTHTVDPGGAVLLERPITTYQFNPAGVADASYLDVTTMMTLSYLRYDVRVMIATKYPRHKLADDGTIVAPGQAMVTPKMLTAELIARARSWEQAGLVNAVDEFKDLFRVERDATDPSRVNAIIPPDIVSGLRIFAGSIQFAF